MSALLLQKISYQYRKSNLPVLKDINCNFECGKVYAIIGPSGSGKTTLLSIMAGLDRPQSGEVFVDGTPLSTLNLDAYRRQKIAMIFQAFQLFPLLTALENVSYPMEINGVSKTEARTRAQELLASVEIDETTSQRFPSHLSGGEQQRVAIARALASGAQILLADEPTGNLDVDNGKNIMDILTALAHDKGYCVIIVTHDLQVAERADVIFRMNNGVLNTESDIEK